ncbi:glycosyltransferase [Desulfosarcina widdelii]|nr:glycosyltransferase [Desulfosarcina widdelii]
MSNHATNILHIITGLSTGGAERSLFNLLNGRTKEPYRNLVVSLSTDGTFGHRLRNIGVQVEVLNLKPRLSFLKSIRQLYRIAERFNPDIIQGWMYHGNLSASLIALLIRGKIPVIWNIRHSLYNLSYEKNSTKLVIRTNRALSYQPTAIVYNSNISREQHESFGFRSKTGDVISNGFDIEHLKPSDEKHYYTREMLGIPKSAFVIGHVARYHPMKNHTGFLKSVGKIANDNKNLHIILCGKGVVAENTLLSKCVPLKSQQQFHFLGERMDVHKIMRGMDLLCLSSRWGEGFPNVLGEAMALGIPCVTADVGESADIVGETGIVVPVNNEKAMRKAIVGILNMSAEERSSKGESARKRVEEYYSLALMVEKYRTLYERLLH